MFIVGLATVGLATVRLATVGLATVRAVGGFIGGFLFLNLLLEACVLEFLLLPMMTVQNCIIIHIIIEYNLLIFTCDSC